MRGRTRLGLAVTAVAVILFSLLVPGPAGAAIEYHLTVPFVDDFDSCTGERVVVSGTARAVGTITQDSAGKLHFANTATIQGQGVGTVSGVRYVLIGTQTTGETVGTATGTATEFALRWSSLLLRQGNAAGDDVMAHLLFHVTQSATGQVTATIDNFTAVCR